MATYTPTPVAVASGSFSISPGATIVFYTVPAGMYARMRITATLEAGTSPISLLAASHRIFTVKAFAPAVSYIYAEAILPAGTTLQSDNAPPGTGGVTGGWSAEFYPNP